jgi:hypothetical protein
MGHHRCLKVDTGHHSLQPAIQDRVLALLLTFQPRMLATAAVGTSSWRASPTVGNASMDDIDATVAVTFFFLTDNKSIVHVHSIVPFIIQAHVEHLPYLPISVFKRPSSAGCDFIDGVVNMGGFSDGEGDGTGNNAVL